MNNIVLATDGSARSDAAARYLVESPLLNRDFTVHVVHCDPSVGGDVRSFVSHDDVAAWHRDVNEKAMLSVTNILREANLVVECHGLVGHTAERIVEYADTIGAAAIVMGSHHRGPFLDVIIGSVSARVIIHAHCPVLLV
jgi:nucleotide-binding universal stress UspA family protein